MQRRALVGIAAGGVCAVVAGGVFVLNAGRDPGTFSLRSEPFETGSPSLPPTGTPSPADPTPYPTPSASTGAPTGSPAATATASGTATATATARPATAAPTYRPGPRRALPSCDAPLPNACAHPDATQAVTGGVKDLSCVLTGATSVRVRWDSDNLDERDGAPPVDEFVVRLWRYPTGSTGSHPDQIRGYDRLYQVRVGRDTFDVTVSNLAKGERYACWVQEVNVAGLSPAMGVRDVRIPGPSPTPSATPSETPSETPGETEGPSPTATP